MPPDIPEPAPEVVKEQIAQVKESEHRFRPSRGLPVWINYQDPRDPFELAEPVVYQNGVVRVEIPAGFKCDAASTPFFVWLVPGLLQSACAVWWFFGWGAGGLVSLLALSVFTSFVLPFVMPGVGQLGLHARAAFTHDALFRTQQTARVVADAIFMEIMAYDGVRWPTRWAIYLLIRLGGGVAWRRNAKILAGKLPPVQEKGPEPKSVLVPEKKGAE